MSVYRTAPEETHKASLDLDWIRENFQALRDFEVSSSEPANPVKHMLWMDLASAIMKQRNPANTGWNGVWDMTLFPPAHRGAAPLDHPDGSVFGIKLNANSYTTGTYSLALGSYYYPSSGWYAFIWGFSPTWPSSYVYASRIMLERYSAGKWHRVAWLPFTCPCNGQNTRLTVESSREYASGQATLYWYRYE